MVNSRTFFDNQLIQRGGGTGPVKPQQPVGR